MSKYEFCSGSIFYTLYPYRNNASCSGCFRTFFLFIFCASVSHLTAALEPKLETPHGLKHLHVSFLPWKPRGQSSLQCLDSGSSSVHFLIHAARKWTFWKDRKVLQNKTFMMRKKPKTFYSHAYNQADQRGLKLALPVCVRCVHRVLRNGLTEQPWERRGVLLPSVKERKVLRWTYFILLPGCKKVTADKKPYPWTERRKIVEL